MNNFYSHLSKIADIADKTGNLEMTTALMHLAIDMSEHARQVQLIIDAQNQLRDLLNHALNLDTCACSECNDTYNLILSDMANILFADNNTQTVIDE